MDYFDRVSAAAAWLSTRVGTFPDSAIVLGSGLGDFGESLDDATSIPYGEIPNFPSSAVIGHAGKLVVGVKGLRRIATFSGRAHFYEGHDMQTVTFAMRVLGRLGVKRVILTNAAGGIDTSFSAGALMIIDDHINMFGTNPLVGHNDDRFGPRFPDMTEVYSKELRTIAQEVATARGIHVEQGIYVGLHGPSYETPAEIRFLRTIGAHAVGMSTVPEAIVARHMGMQVLGLSCITNMAAGVLPHPLHHDEVMETARRVKGEFIGLIEGILEGLPA